MRVIIQVLRVELVDGVVEAVNTVDIRFQQCQRQESIARLRLPDEQSLFDALQTGKTLGVALDTFRHEPPGVDYPMFEFPQVIATPHTGAHTDDATRPISRMALEDCLTVLRGEEPLYRVV